MNTNHCATRITTTTTTTGSLYTSEIRIPLFASSGENARRKADYLARFPELKGDPIWGEMKRKAGNDYAKEWIGKSNLLGKPKPCANRAFLCTKAYRRSLWINEILTGSRFTVDGREIKPFHERIVNRKIDRIEEHGKPVSPYLRDEMLDCAFHIVLHTIADIANPAKIPDFLWRIMGTAINRACDALAYARSHDIPLESIKSWDQAEPEDQGIPVSGSRRFASVANFESLRDDYVHHAKSLRLYWQTNGSRKAKAGLRGDLAMLRKAFQVSIGHGLGSHAGKAASGSAYRQRKMELLKRISDGSDMLASMAESGESMQYQIPLVMGEKYQSNTPRNADLDRIVQSVKSRFIISHGRIYRKHGIAPIC